jgi:hypothetical protein
VTYRTVTTRSPHAVGALALSLAAFATLCLARRTPMVGTLVYRAEGAAVVGGTDLYGFTVTEWRLPATYPPFAAILFVPTTWPPVGLLKAVFVIGNIALLALLVRLSCRFAGLPSGPLSGLPGRACARSLAPSALLAAVAVGLWLEPVFQTVWTARTFWAVPHQGNLDLQLPWWQQPLASPYPLVAVGLLVWTAWRVPVGAWPPAQFPASSSSASTIRYAYPCSARNRCRCAAKSWSIVSRATTE